MAEATLRRTWLVGAPPDVVFDHLTDPRSYVGLTPFVVAVDRIRVSEAGISYVAVERFRILGKTVHNRITVTMRGDRASHTVRQHVDSPGGVTLDSTVALRFDAAGTAVQETIAVRMPWWLAGFVRRQAAAAQAYRADELVRRLG